MAQAALYVSASAAWANSGERVDMDAHMDRPLLQPVSQGQVHSFLSCKPLEHVSCATLYDRITFLERQNLHEITHKAQYLKPYKEEQGHDQAQPPQQRRGGVPLQLVKKTPTHPGVGNGQHDHAVQAEHAGNQPSEWHKT